MIGVKAILRGEMDALAVVANVIKTIPDQGIQMDPEVIRGGRIKLKKIDFPEMMILREIVEEVIIKGLLKERVQNEVEKKGSVRMEGVVLLAITH